MKNKPISRLKKLLHKPSVRYGGISTVILCVFLCILVLVNILATEAERKYALRVDYSFNAATTTGEKTAEILAQLNTPVHIYALYDKGEEDAPLVELLNRYAAASDKVTWEQISPALNPSLLSKFSSSTKGLTTSSLIVYCEATDRWKVLDYSDFITLSLNYDDGIYEVGGLAYESSITGAIVYVTNERIPRILFLQGHGELDQEATKVLVELLDKNQFDTGWIDLTQSEAQLDPEQDLLVILSPLRDLMDTEMDKITEFANHGGSLLFTCDYSDPVDQMPHFAALMRSYGFIPKDGIVVASKDEPNTFYNNTRIHLIPEMVSTDVTIDLLGAGENTLLLAGSRAFETPGEEDRNLIVSEVLRSGEQAYLKVVTRDLTSMDRKPEDVSGPFTLALQARRITTEGYVSKAFVLGCSTMLTDSKVQTMTDSQAFIIRVAEFLTNRSRVDLGIMAKVALRPQLSARSAGLGSVLLVALPLTVLVAALIILLPRKRK